MPRGTTLRNVRVEDDLWTAAQAIANARGENLSADVLRPAIEDYVAQHRRTLTKLTNAKGSTK